MSKKSQRKLTNQKTYFVPKVPKYPEKIKKKSKQGGDPKLSENPSARDPVAEVVPTAVAPLTVMFCEATLTTVGYSQVKVTLEETGDRYTSTNVAFPT